ncbi:Ppx/GppA phosphatase [Bdellovibrio bacteriovorus W]|nr:Ppx/GppA phosphatase [Bdellovibrio bacteriovorus W]
MLRRVSAIDIGSNAIRMMIAQIDSHTGSIKVLRRLRAAIRLGKDTFSKGRISARSQRQAIATIFSFMDIMDELGVTECRAVATSACRDASNGADFVRRLSKVSGLHVRLIDGLEEAQLIHKAVSRHSPDINYSLLLDIGGGSIELSFSQKNRIVQSQSFPLGTVRLLQRFSQKNLDETHLTPFIEKSTSFVIPFLHNNLKRITPEVCVGTGGNMESILDLKQRLFQAPQATTLNLHELSFINDILNSMSYRDRISVLGLSPDRADVIVPAALLTEKILEQAAISVLRIPRVGVRDGLIWEMYDDQRESLGQHPNQ